MTSWKTARRIATLLGALLAAPNLLAQPATPQFTPFITSGLSGPIGVFNAADGSNRLFVIQQGGQVRVWRGGTLQTTAFMGFNSSTTCTYPGNTTPTTIGFTSGGERGLLGLAFHPQYESNGRIFVSITDSAGDTMILRYTKANPAPPASGDDVLTSGDLATCTVVLRADQDFSNHNGGNIAFGPDGFLYLGLGDGGNGGDPCNRALTLDPANLAANDGNDTGCPSDTNYTSNGGDPNSRALLGKMLRLDINVTEPLATAGAGMCGEPRAGQPVAYAIPPNQPGAAGGAFPAACDEVWAYGLRNPWRFSFDATTGDLYVGDVGQSAREEISRTPANAGGINYGWRCFEGSQAFANSGTGCTAPVVARTAPIIEYPRNLISGAPCYSVTGGHVYRGNVQGVEGRYFYADYCTGSIWASTGAGGTWSQPTGPGGAGAPFQQFGNGISTGQGVASFGEDEQRNLYVAVGNQILLLDGPRVPADLLFGNGFEP